VTVIKKTGPEPGYSFKFSGSWPVLILIFILLLRLVLVFFMKPKRGLEAMLFHRPHEALSLALPAYTASSN